MKRWIWNKFIKKWFWEEVAAAKKTQNQRNYIKDMLWGKLKNQQSKQKLINNYEEDFNDGNGFAWPTITSTDVM